MSDQRCLKKFTGTQGSGKSRQLSGILCFGEASSCTSVTTLSNAKWKLGDWLPEACSTKRKDQSRDHLLGKEWTPPWRIRPPEGTG